jgi:DNA polymerase III alpha subunit
MKDDNFGQQILSEDDICNFYMSNPDKIIKSCLTDEIINYPSSIEFTQFPHLINYIEQNISKQDFDIIQQQKWFMPEEYYNMDIALYVLNKCTLEAELQRAGEELFLYQERGLFPLLQYLKYLVDTMRANNIVWGVGRGSSVASYVLFLLGVHRINSLYYDLSIDEFLK